MGGSGPSGRDVLRQAIKGQRRDVALGSLLGAGHQAGEALVPVLIGVVIDQAVAGGDAVSLLVWLAVLAVVYVGLSFSFRFGTRAGERAAEQAAHLLRVRLVTRVVDPRGGAEEGRLPGALTSIATEDAKRVGTVAMAVMFGFSALMGLLVAAVVLLRISIPLGLVVLLGTPVLLWAGHLLSKPLERRSEAEQERAAHASGVAADLVTGLRVLKGIGAESAAVARYRRTSRDSLVATLRAARAEAVQNGMVLTLTGVFIAVVALVGGRLAVDGDISLGQLVSAVGLALFLLGPLEVFSWVNADFAQARASAARIAGVLAAPPGVEPGGARLPERLRGALRLRGVGHGPLRDLDLDVAPGEVLGVAATDPADAAALLRCLSRQTDPDTGVIELDGVPLRDLDPADVRTAMLVAEHDADLFEGTLHGNVASAASAADPEAVLAAMAAAGADEVALAVPRGVDAAVSERGRSLSGGQRQRVALARALAADRPVLVVHDPTTAVDAVTEARIAAGVRELRRGRTTILVTTSPALLAVADRVALLDGGRIADTGPHADLVERHAAYRTAVLA
ncbi:ABC transporter ATP-binding protein [Planotetraspora kaengkrachanensis]|uniref:Multidrug ABC transporter ATP-binding protein n=1 Tax=Planotetraspora kaengkrachanensis TaxID=575193 RepID=A0A8J3PXE6_9ACTN|nr:ABC transporter ATP-binding protein [Planotetraspora kaengkrachanensis]GIG82760.1 multidrug ABC transporter ATP-binding protein [Planotetraspora kaengkrachanensis]